MCKAISLVSVPIGKDESWVYFHSFNGRKKRDEYGNDSHSNIAKNAVKACSFLAAVYKTALGRDTYTRPSDIVNKWEWDPFTGVLRKDSINCKTSDMKIVRDFVKTLEPEEVIGTRVRLTNRYCNAFCVEYRKGRQWLTLQLLYINRSAVPAKFRNRTTIEATVYRKREGGWALKNFK